MNPNEANQELPGDDVAPQGDVTGGGTPDARRIAREQFMHGLLGYLHQDDAATQAARVRRTINALHAAEGERVPAPIAFPRSRWRAFAGMAAALAMTTALISYMIPTTPSATAMVQTSIDAAMRAGDRRYEVRVAKPPGEMGAKIQANASGMMTLGVIDLRGSDRMVVRAKNPMMGDRVAFGRDSAGAWAVRPDFQNGGAPQISRLNAGAARPRWIELGESTVLLDSTESLLAALKTEYEPKRLDPAPLESDGKEVFDRISATKRVVQGPEPQRIEVWISQQTKLVQRIELHWPEMAGPPNGGGGQRSDGEGPGGAGGPAGRRGPRDRPRFDGPPPGPVGPGPDEDGVGPDGPPPRGPGGPGGPRRPGERPEDRGPRGPEHRMGPPGGPEGPEGRGGPGGPEGPGGFGRRPKFLDGPPDFARENRPPPRKIVFELVAGEQLSDDWFSPEAHVKWAGEGQRPGGGN